MSKRGILVLAVCAALTLTSFAASRQEGPTVGTFVQKLSVALGHPATSPEAAATELRKLGVKNLNADLSARITEGRAAEILRDLSIRVTVKDAAKELSPATVDRLVTVASLGATASSSVSPADLPANCLELRNRGNCQECCKAELGCDPSPALCDFANECSHFCKSVLPPGKASPEEPTP